MNSAVMRVLTRVLSIAVVIVATTTNVAAQQQSVYGIRTRMQQDPALGGEFALSEVLRVDPTSGAASLLTANLASDGSLPVPIPVGQALDFLHVDDAGIASYFQLVDDDIHLWRLTADSPGRKICTFRDVPSFQETSDTALRIASPISGTEWVLRAGEDGGLLLDESDASVTPIVTPFHPLSYNPDNRTVLALSAWGIISVDLVTGAPVENLLETNLLAYFPSANLGVVAVIPREGGGYGVLTRYNVSSFRSRGFAVVSAEGANHLLYVQDDVAAHSANLVQCTIDGLLFVTNAQLHLIQYTDSSSSLSQQTAFPASDTRRVQIYADRLPTYWSGATTGAPGESVTIDGYQIESAWTFSSISLPLRVSTEADPSPFLLGDGPALPTDAKLMVDTDNRRLLAFGQAEAETQIVAIDIESGDRTLLATGPHFDFVSIVSGAVHTLAGNSRPPTPDEYVDLLLGMHALPFGVVAPDRNEDGQINVGDLVRRVREQEVLP